MIELLAHSVIRRYTNIVYYYYIIIIIHSNRKHVNAYTSQNINFLSLFYAFEINHFLYVCRHTRQNPIGHGFNKTITKTTVRDHQGK